MRLTILRLERERDAEQKPFSSGKTKYLSLRINENPLFEISSNPALLKTHDDKMAIALWKMRSCTSKDEFQAFSDRFVYGYANNKVFQVEHAIGIRKLDA
eukprot:scaffold9880_cov132-Skeletonema_marinoi.AAC.1